KYDGTAPLGTVNSLHTTARRPGISGTTNEKVNGISITVNGMTMSAQISNERTSWSLLGTQYTSDLPDGTYDVVARFTDDAGNTGQDTTVDELIVDNSQPLLTLSANPEVTNKKPFPITLTANKPINQPALDDFTITNGSATGVTKVDDQTYTIDISATAEGDVTIQVPEAALTDTAGNPNRASNTIVVVYDVSSPTAVISGSTSKARGVFGVGITISEKAGIGLTADDFVVENGAASKLTHSVDYQYGLTITPASDGPVRIHLPAGAFTDEASNGNLISNTFEQIVDSTAPGIPTVKEQVVTNRRPTIEGTYDIANTDRLVIGIGKRVFSTTDLAPIIVLDNGKWSIDFSKTSISFEYGVYDIYATAYDDAGNPANDTTHDELVIDSPYGSDISGTVDALKTADKTPELTGTVNRQNATNTVKIGNETYEAINNKDGSWTLPNGTIKEDLENGTYEVSLTLVDDLDEGTDTTKNELTVDDMAPSGTLTRIITELGSPRLYGTVDQIGTEVTVELYGKTYYGKSTGDYSWEIPMNTIEPPLQPGKHLATITLKNPLGKEAFTVVRSAITVLGAVSKEPSPMTPQDNESFVPSIVRPEAPKPDIVETPKVVQPDQPIAAAPRPVKAKATAKKSSIPASIIALCVTAALGTVGGLFYIVAWKKRRKKEDEKDKDGKPENDGLDFGM
ncbi:MAG: conserved repeat domain protein, partial [Candidatus Saccharibacteria bacterium]|nr:conserved repeat domain protein [Candidatus Saccharibacteria bacterium]